MQDIYGRPGEVSKEDIKPSDSRDTFPYFRYCMTREIIAERLARLATYKFTLKKQSYRINNMSHLKNLTFRGGPPTVAICSPDDYTKYNKISDYYQDYARCRARRYDNELSSYDFWLLNWDKLYDLIEGPKTAYSLREAIYFAQKEVGSFRCTNLAGTIEMFKSRNVLDFSAGWGDRLAAAVAKKVKYTGVDPNTLVHEGYEEFIRDFGGDLDIKMICSPFEDPAIDSELESRGPYDLVFTSPPYFNLEIYSDEPTQSADEDSDIDGWLTGFLFPTLSKCVRLMAPGGKLVIVINDMAGENAPKFTEKMIAWLNGRANLKYIGVLSYAEMHSSGKLRSPQPMWMWQLN